MTIRFTKPEIDKLNELKTERYIADYVRRCALNYKKSTDNIATEIDPKLLIQVIRIGNNINQIAKRINGLDDTAIKLEILLILELLKNEIENLKQIGMD